MTLYLDNMNYRNVVLKRYTLRFEEREACMLDFLTRIDQRSWHINGPLTYMLEPIKNDDRLCGRFLIPVQSDSIATTSEFEFHSFYALEHALCCRLNSDFESGTPKGIEALKRFALQNGYKTCTPVYFVVGGYGDNDCLHLKIGITRPNRALSVPLDLELS